MPARDGRRLRLEFPDCLPDYLTDGLTDCHSDGEPDCVSNDEPDI